MVDETRRSGGVGEGVVTALVEQGFAGPIGLVASKDSFVPLGDAALTVLVSEDEIEAGRPGASSTGSGQAAGSPSVVTGGRVPDRNMVPAAASARAMRKIPMTLPNSSPPNP